MIKRLVNHLEEGVIAFLLVGMTALVVAEVIGRFVFNHGVLWIEELTLHASAWMVLFGASWALKEKAHIGVDAFVKLFSVPIQRAMGIAGVGIALGYCGVLSYGGWIYLSKIKKIGIELEDIPVQKWMAHSIMVIGLVMLSIRLLQLLWRIIKGEEIGFGHVDEADTALEEAHLDPYHDAAGKDGGAS